MWVHLVVDYNDDSGLPFRRVLHFESRHSWSLQGIVLDIATTRRLTLTLTVRVTAGNGWKWRPLGMADPRNGGPTPQWLFFLLWALKAAHSLYVWRDVNCLSSVVRWTWSTGVRAWCNVRGVCCSWTASVHPFCWSSSDNWWLQCYNCSSHALWTGLSMPLNCLRVIWNNQGLNWVGSLTRYLWRKTLHVNVQTQHITCEIRHIVQ